MGRLNKVVTAVQEGDLKARAEVRKSGDELDELGQGLNTMLDRLEASMASIRHAGDAIAHDLRSPLTRMRAKLEVALIDAEAGKIDGVDALAAGARRGGQSAEDLQHRPGHRPAAGGGGRTPDPMRVRRRRPGRRHGRTVRARRRGQGAGVLGRDRDAA